MTTRFAAIFIYADGCSLRLDHLIGDPPPHHVALRTEARFKDGVFRFCLQAVHRDSGEAWYQEAGRLPSGDERDPPSRPPVDSASGPGLLTSCLPRLRTIEILNVALTLERMSKLAL
jgi:hypothetical protein